MQNVRVALAQLAPKLGDLQANLESHLSLITDAERRDSDLIVFPELSLTGYLLQDQVPEVSITEGDAVFSRLAGASRSIDIVVGTHAHEHEVGVPGGVSRSRRGYSAVLARPPLRCGRRSVVHPNVMSRRSEVTRHRVTHVSQPNKCTRRHARRLNHAGFTFPTTATRSRVERDRRIGGP